MNSPTEQVHLWNYVFQIAETLETTPRPQARTVLLEQLGTLREAFSESTDPVENYEAYVTVKLCAQIERVLLEEKL